MSVGDRAANPASTLCRFLDARLPHLDVVVVVEQWIKQVDAAPWAAIDVDANRAQLGTALEIRLGLDLADIPAYWELLSFLPAEDCHAMLTAADFSPADYDHMPVDGTSDPLLLSWSRTTRPSGCDDPAQRAALAVCVDAAGIDKVAHRLHTMPAAQVRRSLFLALRDAATRATEADPVSDGLHHMWRGYLRHARPELMRMGERVLIAPPLAPGVGEGAGPRGAVRL
jgi:hypothetical protein